MYLLLSQYAWKGCSMSRSTYVLSLLWSDYYSLLLANNVLVNHDLFYMSKVTSLCQTFNQSLYNTIYLRFSFEYLFENFIIVSLHMCIRYFFILFYFSYSSRQIVYFFCCINCNVCTTHFFVLHHPVLEFVRKIYEICTFLVLTWKRKILKMQV
jgi:hypothetical protein